MVQGLGFKGKASSFNVWGLGLIVTGLGIKGKGFRVWVQGLGFRV